MENHTAKHFVLQLGSLASLYVSLIFLLVLLFGFINLQFPDATDSVWQLDNYEQMVRIGFAMVIVFFPAYLVLTRLVNSARRQAPQGAYLGLTKWLIYLSLLVGGAVLLGDLVAVINTFLNGDITTRFVLKVLAVLVVVGAAFFYYIQDSRGFWIKNEKCSIRFGALATALVLIALGAGLAAIDAPTDVREQKLDDTQISDLQNIQWQIQDHLAVQGELPQSLAELTQIKLPEAPEDRPAYQYELTETGFKLCATFATASREDMYGMAQPMMPTEGMVTIVNPDNWQHEAGEVCFERVVR